MNERIAQLRRESHETPPSVSIERALLVTEFYRSEAGKHSTPVMRALNFKNLCEKKSIYIGERELIVGERGPRPRAVPTFPELNCHSAEDFGDAPPAWQEAYAAGLFTEFMEQRAPGHTALDGAIYRKGLLDFKDEIGSVRTQLDFLNDPEAAAKSEQLKAMAIACDAAILFAERHAELAEAMAAATADAARRAELARIASVCRRVPARAPRDLWEALQMYWFVHLATITELNGWDAMTPGHLDQHLEPFYRKELSAGTLTREKAKELIACLWIKFNNHPAPPKVGVTAKESGTYNDFSNINLGGLTREGANAAGEVSLVILEVADELHLLQPQASVHISDQTPEHFLKAACRVIRKGYGYPSVFNADAVVMEMLGAGKRLEDAREGGCSGCVETGAFGKEAFILTGYLNVPKVLELALFNGVDPLTGRQIGPRTGDPLGFTCFEDLYDAFERQLAWVVDLKLRMNNLIERIVAAHAPAPFLSVVISDCIAKGRDYYDGGPRYNTNYIQCCGIGTVTDSLSAVKTHVFDDKSIEMERLVRALAADFEGEEALCERLRHKTPFFGNDDDRADAIMRRVYQSLLSVIEGRPNTKGGVYHLNMLSTTCHVYFGKMLGATPNGRRAGRPASDGTSPSHGADRNGPTAVLHSLGKMDQIRSGGTLLNMRFLPSALASERDIEKLAQLIRTYFRMNGHHIQFNVVDTDTLRRAQTHPDEYRDLLVRVAGYSDYFVDLDRHHQEEIIHRTAHSN
nr:glycyl radical protein [Desulfobacterales bacterium]